MRKPKYEKIVCINEVAWGPEILCDILSKLVYCMFETNKINNETFQGFTIETCSVDMPFAIGIKLRFGCKEED